MKPKIKICFVSLFCYPLFKPDSMRLFGGSEVRVARFARALARREELEINLVVLDHGQNDLEAIDGVNIYSWPGKTGPLASIAEYREIKNVRDNQGNSGSGIRRAIRRMRYHHRAWVSAPVETSLTIFKLLVNAFRNVRERFCWIGLHVVKKSDISIFDKIEADIYISPGVNEISAMLGAYCKKRRKKNIILCASDHDYSTRHKLKPLARSVYGSFGFVMTRAIRLAGRHVVQTESQARQLEEHYGRSSILIKNPAGGCTHHRSVDSKTGILWVGKAHPLKQPELVLKLARTLPEYRFTMIMNYNRKGNYQACTQIADQLENLDLLDYVPYHEISAYYARARILINTARIEGFPNTFLEAAACGTPLVSLNVDPGGMLTDFGCGIFCEGQPNRLARAVRILHSDPAGYAEMSANCSSYIREHHNADQQAHRLAELITELHHSVE